jgi:hypothetical protein
MVVVVVMVAGSTTVGVVMAGATTTTTMPHSGLPPTTRGRCGAMLTMPSSQTRCLRLFKYRLGTPLALFKPFRLRPFSKQPIRVIGIWIPVPHPT